MSEPETEAGRALLERESLNSRSFALITPEAVLAIEAELRAKLAEQLRQRPGLNGVGAAALIEGSDPASPPEAALDERVGRMQTALGGAGVLADGLNSWSAARAVIDHLDALAYAGQPFASVPRLAESSRG